MTSLAFAGMPEWLIIVIVILLLFGASRIPQLARSLGKSMGEFKKGVREGNEEDGQAGKKDEESSKKS